MSVSSVPRWRLPAAAHGALGLAMLVVGCAEPSPEMVTGGGEAAEVGAEVLLVGVVNHPLEYFAGRLGGEGVDVLFPAPSGVDPASWSPGADIVGAYQQADLIFLNGAGYAGWVERSSLPASRIVDTAAGFYDRLIPLESSVTHSHGTQGEHSHEGLAATLWLDPELASAQAAAVAASLAASRPEIAEGVEQRLGELEEDLRSLDERLKRVAERLSEEPLLFSQPVYQYWIRRYGLHARILHWQPDEGPDEEAWSRLGRLLEEHRAGWMIWDSEPSEATSSELARRGVESLVYELAANRPSEGDFLAQMRVNVERLEAAFPVVASGP